MFSAFVDIDWVIKRQWERKVTEIDDFPVPFFTKQIPHMHIYIHVCLAGIVQRDQWEMPYTRAIGAIRTTVAIGGNREAK